MYLLKIKRIMRKHFENGFLLYFILGAIYTLGIILGAILLKKFNIDDSNLYLRFSNPFFKNNYYYDYGNYSVFKSSVLGNGLLILSMYLFGLLGIGFVFIPLLIFLKGSALGLTVGYLVKEFGLRGFLVSVFGIYPQSLFIIPGIIAIGAVTMSMSLSYKTKIKKRFIKARGIINLNDYTILILVFAFIVLIGSLIEGWLSPMFLKQAVNYFY